MTCTLVTDFATAERAAPAEIEATHRSIASTALLVLVLDALPEQVMILNRFRQVVYANAASRAVAASLGHSSVLGLRPGELLACSTAGETAGGCGTAEACRTCGAAQAILAAIDGRKAEQECRIGRPEGPEPSALDLRVWATPFLWNGAEHVLFVAHDIADEKRRQVLERVFFHDIMNTAGGINSMAGMLSAGDLAFEEVKDDLTAASDTLVQEIRSQRILVAAENNTLAVQRAPIGSLAFLDALVHTFRNHLVAQGKRIVIAPDAAACRFTSDEALLARVVGNLLKNALEASTPGQCVTLGCRAEGAELTFSCHNESVMARQVQLQIFQRSFSTKGSDRGIGTYSIKLLTEKYLGGRVAFSSAPETGTVFTVALPVA